MENETKKIRNNVEDCILSPNLKARNSELFFLLFFMIKSSPFWLLNIFFLICFVFVDNNHIVFHYKNKAIKWKCSHYDSEIILSRLYIPFWCTAMASIWLISPSAFL